MLYTYTVHTYIQTFIHTYIVHILCKMQLIANRLLGVVHSNDQLQMKHKK